MALVKVEFCEKTLGETVKLECSPDKPAEFNFNAVVTVTFDDTCNLDEIAYRQVLCEYNQYKPLCCMNAPVYSSREYKIVIFKKQSPLNTALYRY